ncbi:MAG: M15 family metallopeptidase [Ruminococcus sp.]|nr:M15 family metallopeptidase [Candidatus Copronaster equi]
MKKIMINFVTLLVLTLTVITISAKTQKSPIADIDTFARQASEASSNADEINNAEDTTTEFSTSTTKKTRKQLITSPSTTKGEKKTKKTQSSNAKIEEKDGLTYVNGVLIANKTYALPESYEPGVDSTAEAALEEMKKAAAEDGVNLWIMSGFRSYSTQAGLYNDYVDRDGKAEADTYSARPGHSEHQTGLAFDLNSLKTSFEDTAEGIWLAKNCYKYGFIIRYPKGKESITGYQYEPWHVRYLGTDLSTKVYQSGLCLEEYLGITSRYSD